MSQETLGKYFPEVVKNELTKADGWYSKAFSLVTNNSQKLDDVYPQDQYSANDLKVKTQLEEVTETKFEIMPIATELNAPAIYRFPQGAYSTTVALLNRMYAKDQYLTVLLHTEVIQLEIPQITTELGRPEPKAEEHENWCVPLSHFFLFAHSSEFNQFFCFGFEVANYS